MGAKIFGMGLGVWGMVLGLAATESRAGLAYMDCTTPINRKVYRKVCKKVVDPIKMEAGQFSTVDCTAETQDGYTIGICSKVSLAQQKAWFKKQAQKPPRS